MNLKYDQVRIQIMKKEEILSLNELILIIRSEESKRRTMLQPHYTDSSAIISQDCKPRQQLKKVIYYENATLGANSRDNLWCTFYKKLKHTKHKY